ncbi:MAG TPA: hypothetical protein VFV50_06105 [Bdellovibrionales bacterium]|nr:hypothetical protein [Bdellovibrionales bacterium]
MMKHAFVLILMSLLASAASAYEAFTYRDLAQKIKEKNGELTVNELLLSLPASLRRSFTLLKTSESLQEASWKYPRVLMFNDNLVLAFNTHASQKGYAALEIIDIDKNRRVFNFQEVREVTENGKPRLEFTEKTPSRCLSCHGTDPKPIWTSYLSWPKAYGSHDDFVAEDSVGETKVEFGRFPELLKTMDEPASRLKALIFPEGSKTSPYFDGGLGKRDYRFRPNMVFTKILANGNALRVNRILKSQADYQKLRAVLWLGLTYSRVDTNEDVGTPNCGDFEGSEAAKKKVEALLGRPTEIREVFGALLGYWGLSIARLIISDGDDNYSFWDGELDQKALLLALELTEAARDDAELKALVGPIGRDYAAHYDKHPGWKPIDDFRSELLLPKGAAGKSFCELLFRRIADLAN